MPPALTDPFDIGPVRIPNRVVLAPLAGIGNWFVRLQAKRYGAGLAVSEMVSSFGVHYGNEKTCVEMLRIHPDERSDGRGPVSIQLFGQDPEIMRSAAATVAERGADLIDLNMGCPVPKVCKTGAGAALIKDPDTAVKVARAAREGSGLPVTVKLRSGQRPGETDGYELAHRLVHEAGVSAIGFHPRSAAVHHKGVPDYDLAAKLVETLDAPVILTGGLSDREAVRRAYERTGAAAVMLARGSLGNPWLFAQLLGAARRRADARRGPRASSTGSWTAPSSTSADRAPARYLRQFYPWYVERLGADKAVQQALQQTASLDEARAVLRASGACRGRRSLALYCPARIAHRPPRPPLRAGFSVGGERPRQGPMARDVILTPEGLERLKEELQELQTTRRREVAERIKEAREFGDISENSEYDDAKNEQMMLEQRIAQLEERLRSAQVVDPKDISTDAVQVGSVVSVKDEKTGKSQKFTIVGSAEANPKESKLSNESPVGRALIGHKRNDVVSVQVPRGPARKLKITKIDVGL